ncbi:minor structural protein [Bifidobacterium longum]|uniref:Minor structural protein n=1 Tax=Bifidobacterium longum TaxID=216816 RepID=A0A2N0TKC3_BIFLN|nr:phage tail spike protein [Bifidobacterium longum]PKD15195.1 minor structural protein [Bifidobacterium longum]
MRFACFDRWDTPKPDPTGVTEAKWTSGVDSTRNLELTCMGETTIGKGDRILFADPRGNLQETIVVSPEHRREDTRIITSLVCKGSIQELDDTFIEDKRNRTATATQCLRKALEGTRWTVGTVDDDGTTADLSFYHVSALEAVESIASEYGLEITSSYLMDPQHLRITNRAVNLVKAQGDQSNEGLRRFEYGHDLKGVTRTVDATGVKTRLYGYGKGLPATDEEGNETGGYGRRIDFSDINNGKPYVEDTEATKLWGLPGPADEALGDNLINNGDFEKGAGRADGWTFSPSLAFLDAQITGDGNIKPHAGTTMLRMGTDTDTCASKAHGDSIKAKPGVTYELSFWTLANPGETFKVSIRQGYTAYPDPTIKITPATNTGQWTRTRQRFTIDFPKEINIWIIFEKPTGTIYLDDVELRALTSTTIHPAEGIYENGDCEDKQQLLEETKAELERRSVPTVSYEADILTFARSGTDLNGVGLGDRVLLVDTTFTPDLRLAGRVLQLEEDLFDPALTTVTIGNIIERFTTSNRSAKQRLERVVAESAAWDTSSQQISQNAGKWDQVAQTVVDNATQWNQTAATVNDNAADWNATYETVSSKQADWDAAASTVSQHSDEWDTAATAVTEGKPEWDAATDMVTKNSGAWSESGRLVQANKDAWTDAALTVSQNQAAWDRASTDVSLGKADWDEAYVTAVNLTQSVRQSGTETTLRHGDLAITLGDKISLTDQSDTWVFENGTFVKQ